MLKELQEAKRDTPEQATRRAAKKLRTWLERRVADGSKDIARMFRGNRDSMVQKLRQVYDTFLQNEPSILQARRTGAVGALDQIINQHIQALTDEFGNRSIDMISQMHADHPEQVNEHVAPLIGGVMAEPIPKPYNTVLGELTTAITGGGTYEDRLLNITGGMKDSLFGAVRTSLIAGSDFETLSNKVMGIFGVDNLAEPKSNAYGSVQIYRNEARRQWNDLMTEFAQEKDQVAIWYAWLDENTTPGCAARHGIPIDHLDDDPPRHYNCRCEVMVVDRGTDLQEFQAEGAAWLEANGYSRSEAYMEESWAREAFDPGKHPRDEHGRWASAAAHERLPANASEDRAPGGKWEYHATDGSHLSTIARDGLVARSEARGISTAPHLDAALFYSDAVQGTPVLLRMARKDVAVRYPDDQGNLSSTPTPKYDRDETREHMVVKSVPPEQLEVYHAGAWHALVDKKKKESGTSAGAKAGWAGRMKHAPAPEGQQHIVDWIDKAGAVFNGMQERPDHPGYYVFTDKQTGSTVLLDATKASPEAFKQKVDEKRAEFAQYRKQSEAYRPAWGTLKLALMSDDVESSVDPLYCYGSIKLSQLPELASRGAVIRWAESLRTARRYAEPDSVPLKAPRRLAQQKPFLSGQHIEALTSEGWQRVKQRGTWVEVAPGNFVLDGPSLASWSDRQYQASRAVLARYPQLDTIRVREHRGVEFLGALSGGAYASLQIMRAATRDSTGAQEAFDPAKHPRDEKGKFLSTGAERIVDAQRNDNKADYHEYGPGDSSEQFANAHPAIQKLLGQEEGKSSAENEIIVALSEQHNNRMIITRGDELVSVISWHEYPGKSVIVQHLGSIAKGGGTKAILGATKAALQLDVPLKFQSTQEAVGFYDKMGFTPDSSRPREDAWYKTSPEDLEKVVNKSLGAKKESSTSVDDEIQRDLNPTRLLDTLLLQGKPAGQYLVLWCHSALPQNLEMVVELASGKMLFAAHPFPPGAEVVRYRMAVLCTEDGKVWAIKPTGSSQWYLPGGHKEQGETRGAAAVREMLEETGVRCKLLGVEGEIHRPEFTTVVFRVEKVGQVPPTTPDEVSEIALIDPENLDVSERYWVLSHMSSA